MEAGCREKTWIYDKNGNAKRYQYIASGILLQENVCIGKHYRKYIAPNGRQTKVHTTIEYHEVRDVNAKKQTASIDLLATLRWFDPNIKTNFKEEIDKKNGIILETEKVYNIWIPDLYIWNRTSIKSKDEWAFLKMVRILMTNETMDEDSVDNTIVELKYEIKTTIYCKFEYFTYPMDSQNCSVRIGSGSDASLFVLDKKDQSYHESKYYSAVGLNLIIDFFGYDTKDNGVGFHIQMNRLLSPFMMKYYIPSIAIVIVSEIGFMVPLTAIPGRVALLVTQFLTLVNLFIYQMVN